MANKKGSLTRLSGPDVAIAEEILKAAIVLTTPERTQAALLKSQMEAISALRQKGCSWEQINQVLRIVGVNLGISTVRSYYCRMNKKAKCNGEKKNRQH